MMPDCFVFGSNLKGIHGAGAALYAWKYHGAEMGNGIGQQGNSYAIPTKDEYLHTLPLQDIEQYVNEFIDFATTNSHMKFLVTKIGCGLAGYRNIDIAPMFMQAPINCTFDTEWGPYMPHKEFWGTF